MAWAVDDLFVVRQDVKDRYYYDDVEEENNICFNDDMNTNIVWKILRVADDGTTYAISTNGVDIGVYYHHEVEYWFNNSWIEPFDVESIDDDGKGLIDD